MLVRRSNDYDSAKPNSTSYIVDSRARHTHRQAAQIWSGRKLQVYI